MFAEFFQTAPLPNGELYGVYNPFLVALSFMVAVFASYIALDLTGRLRDPNNTKASRLLWLIGGAIAMGAGIWSMHFIGMLSFSIPGLTLQYGKFWTSISLLVAIVASGFALFLLQVSIINLIHLIAGGVLLGLAIASMHYTGMEAMLISLNFRYLPSLFFLSILIAILASEAAIWLALKSNKIILRLRNRVKLISAVIMGLAICGMHYTGMAASVFTPLCSVGPVVNNYNAVDPTILSVSIAAVTFIVLGIAFFASTYKEALNQQQFEKMRQLGMAELSASVLHSVGNVLNSVNVAANSIAEQVAASRLSELQKLCSLLNEHKDDLPTFFKNDPRGVKIPEFLDKLAEYWQNEKAIITQDVEILLKHTILIKDIISTQQELNKSTEAESILSINELIDESLLISGFNLKKEIIVQRNYEKMSAIITDKVKLLQIIVNILSNAKDALIESKKDSKILIVTTSVYHKQKVLIEITDNGVGILQKNINKIFQHGFTTKNTGHGFGLHTSIIAIHELGGEMRVKSEGEEQGATFTLELPYRLPK